MPSSPLPGDTAALARASRSMPNVPAGFSWLAFNQGLAPPEQLLSLQEVRVSGAGPTTGFAIGASGDIIQTGVQPGPCASLASKRHGFVEGKGCRAASCGYSWVAFSQGLPRLRQQLGPKDWLRTGTNALHVDST